VSDPLHHVLMRPIVITSSNNVIYGTEEGGSNFTATVTPGTYYQTRFGQNGSLFGAVSAALSSSSGLGLDYRLEAQVYHKSGESLRYLFVHDSSDIIEVFGSDALTTFPLSTIGLAPGADTTVPSGGLNVEYDPEHLWVSTQPIFTVDDSPPRVDVAEMETPSGRSFRAKHSEIKRFRTLSERNLARGRMLAAGLSASDRPRALESFWSASLLERFRVYAVPRASGDALATMVHLDHFVGEYSWTAEALTGFPFRRSITRRVPLYDIDLSMREVVP
jgi:hypothetical protein